MIAYIIKKKNEERYLQQESGWLFCHKVTDAVILSTEKYCKNIIRNAGLENVEIKKILIKILEEDNLTNEDILELIIR